MHSGSPNGRELGERPSAQGTVERGGIPRPNTVASGPRRGAVRITARTTSTGRFPAAASAALARRGGKGGIADEVEPMIDVLRIAGQDAGELGCDLIEPFPLHKWQPGGSVAEYGLDGLRQGGDPSKSAWRAASKASIPSPAGAARMARPARKPLSRDSRLIAPDYDPSRALERVAWACGHPLHPSRMAEAAERRFSPFAGSAFADAPSIVRSRTHGGPCHSRYDPVGRTVPEVVR
jgi:hypothetical protein